MKFGTPASLSHPNPTILPTRYKNHKYLFVFCFFFLFDLFAASVDVAAAVRLLKRPNTKFLAPKKSIWYF